MELKKACFVTFFSLAGTVPAVAQDTAGTISGTLGLDPAIWYVTSDAGEGSSGWRWVGNEVEARLVGQVRRDAPNSTAGALTISLRTEGNPTEMNVSQFTISFAADEGSGDDTVDYSAGAANADLDLETLVISGDEMVLAGSFAGKLIRGGADELALDDDMQSVTVDGNFQATLPNLPSE